jgi:formylglycine-generating enzyme required for sulfatase activity
MSVVSSRRPRGTALRRVVLSGVVLLGVALVLAPAAARGRGCPAHMALVDDAFCIDRYEATVEELGPKGPRPHSPYEPVTGKKVRALSRRGVVPQGYISKLEAEAACAAAKKRLCTSDEWVRACRGRRPTRYPYGDEHKPGQCNDRARVSPVVKLYGALEEGAFAFGPMNDPRLNQVPGTLARTAAHARCTNGYGVFDMVGNLHEWVADESGVFRGGYFLDVHQNGEGCAYKTVAHGPEYHDYSTGFRCCAAAR